MIQMTRLDHTSRADTYMSIAVYLESKASHCPVARQIVEDNGITSL